MLALIYVNVLHDFRLMSDEERPETEARALFSLSFSLSLFLSFHSPSLLPLFLFPAFLLLSFFRSNRRIEMGLFSHALLLRKGEYTRRIFSSSLRSARVCDDKKERAFLFKEEEDTGGNDYTCILRAFR